MSPPAGRRRLALAIVAALLAVSVAGWLLVSQDGPGTDASAGRSAAASTATEPSTADCGPLLRQPTDGAGDHVDNAEYDAAPPAFGDHSERWEVRASSFYDTTDRPDVDVLVHNLEHGYNILWYDQSVVDDEGALARVRDIADDYAALGRSPDPSKAFIAAPWTTQDGGPFPEGMHVALTHWYADPDDPTGSRSDEEGLTRYCPAISESIVEDWMTEHPLREAPEGYPDLM